MKEEAFYKHINTCFNEGRPMAVYHKPASDSIVARIQNDDSLITQSSKRNNGFIFAPFDPDANWVMIPEDFSEYISMPFDSFENAEIHSGIHPDDSIPSEPERYKKLVAKAKDSISDTALRKVVLSRPIDLKCSHSAIDLFKRLLRHNPKAMVYLFYHPDVGVWLGATPEQLLKVENNQLTSVSLAGTKSATTAPGLNWSRKELIEQHIVTEYIENVLGPFAARISKSEVETVEAGSVMHLKTKIKADLNKGLTDLIPLIRALHPTPAVCGTPKTLAMDFIKREEGYDREFYTGFLGEIRSNDGIVADLFVNLRCMKLQDGMARVFVGGGITSDSDPVSEWIETVEKSKTMVKVIGFSGIE